MKKIFTYLLAILVSLIISVIIFLTIFILSPIQRDAYISLMVDRYELTAGETAVTIQNPFNDIGDSPYREDIILGYQLGITVGYGDGGFHPDQIISWGQAVTMYGKTEMALENAGY